MSPEQQRIYELEETVLTLAAWLVSAQTGFGGQDYDGVKKIIEKNRVEHPFAENPE